MNFDLSEEQRLLADSVKRYLDKEYTFEKRKNIVASEAGYSEDAWKAFAELGLLALPIPTEHGGFGGTALDLMPVMELFGEALVVEPYLSTVMCARMLVQTVTPSAASAATTRGPILSAIAEGAMKLALAHTEDDARYDLSHVTTRARRDGDGYVLDGVKRVVLHAPQADRLIVSARLDPQVALFIVDPKASGISMTAYRTIDELVAADVALKGVRVAAADRIDEDGTGMSLLEDAFDYGTALLCAEAVGAMKSANDATLDYLKTRKQFGVPIGSFQALQHRMVDMVIACEQARSMASLAAAATSNPDPEARGRAVAAAKLRICDACERVSKESVQLHGGMGMTEELKVSHTFRRLTTLRQLHGDDGVQLERFAAS